jgi:hypothetical protein
MQSALLQRTRDNLQPLKSLWQKYMERHQHMAPDVLLAHGNVTFYGFATTFDWSRTYKPRPRVSPRLLAYFPRYNSARGGDQYEDFCRVRVVLQHHLTQYTSLP